MLETADRRNAPIAQPPVRRSTFSIIFAYSKSAVSLLALTG